MRMCVKCGEAPPILGWSCCVGCLPARKAYRRKPRRKPRRVKRIPPFADNPCRFHPHRPALPLNYSRGRKVPLCKRCYLARLAQYLGEDCEGPRAARVESVWKSQRGVCPVTGLAVTLGYDDCLIALDQERPRSINNFAFAHLSVGRQSWVWPPGENRPRFSFLRDARLPGPGIFGE